MAGDEIDRVIAGDDSQHRPDLAGHVERQPWAVGRRDADARHRAQCCRVNGVPEAHLHLLRCSSAQALHGVEPPVFLP